MLLSVVPRAILVLGAAAAISVGGDMLLHANSMVKPMWTGPQAVAMAQAQLGHLQAAEARTQQAMDSLQADVQQLSGQVDQASALLTELQSAQEFEFGGRGFGGRGFGRDDG